MAWWTEQRLHPKAKSKFVVVFGTSFFIPSVKTVGKPKIDFDTKEYKLLNHKFNYPGNGTWQPIELKFVDMNGLGDTDDTFDTSAFLWQILNNTGYAYPYLDDNSNSSNNPYYNNVRKQKVASNGGHHVATKISFRDDQDTEDVKEKSSFRTITTPEKSSTIANSFGKGLDGNLDNKAAHYSRQKITIYQLSPEGADSDGKGAKIVECWHLVNPIVKSIGWGDLSYDSDELVEYSLNIVYDWAIYDRKAIGTTFVPDAQPYRDFMKSYALAQSAIDQEQITQQFEALEDLGQLDQFDLDNNGTISANEAFRAQQDALLREGSFIDGAFDADGDGVISEAERLFSENNREQIEKKLTEAEILDEQAERRLISLQAEAAQEKFEKREELKTYTDDYVAQTIIEDYDDDTLSQGVRTVLFDVDYEREKYDAAMADEQMTDKEKEEYRFGILKPLLKAVDDEDFPMDRTPKEGGSGGLGAGGGGIGGGGDTGGDLVDGLMDLDTWQRERTNSENVGIDTGPSEPYTTDPNLDYEDDKTTSIEDDPDWQPLEEGPSYQGPTGTEVFGEGVDTSKYPQYNTEEDSGLEIVPAPRAPQEDTEIDPADQDDTLDD